MKKIRLYVSKIFPPKLRSYLLRVGTAFVLAVPAYAQAGASPWQNAVNALQTSFTGPDCHRIEPGGDRYRRLDVCLWRRPIEARLRRHRVRDRHGRRRGEFHWHGCFRQLTRHAYVNRVYKVMNLSA